MKPQHKIMFFGFFSFFFPALSMGTYIRSGWNDWIILFLLCSVFSFSNLYRIVKKYWK